MNNKLPTYDDLLKEVNQLKKENLKLKKQNKELANTPNSLYDKIYNSLDELLVVIDTASKILLANDKFLRFYEISEKNIKGLPLEKIIGKKEYSNRHKLFIENTIESKNEHYQNICSEEIDISLQKYCKITYIPLKNDNNEVFAVLINSKDITKIKQNQLNIEELSSVVEKANEAIIKTDSKFRIKYLNKTAQKLYGWKLEEIENKNPKIFFANEDVKSIEQTILKSLYEKGTYLGVAYSKTKTGRVFYTEFKISTISDANKNIVAYVAFIRDVSERMIREEKIKQDRKYLRNLISSMRDLMFVFDKNGKFVDFNRPKNSNDLFTPSNFFVNKHYSSTMPEDVSEKITKALQKLKKGSKVQVFDYSLVKDNVVNYYNAILSRLNDDYGNYHGCIAIVRDITKQVAAQKELIQNENKYKNLVNNSPDIIYRYSPQLGTLFCSQRVEDILGYSVQELYDNPFLWTNSIDEKYLEKINKAIYKYKENDVNKVEYEITTKNGNKKWFSDVFTSKVVKDDVIIIEGHASDVTEVKNAQAEIIERKNFINTILDNMPSAVYVHDFKGNLIISNLQASLNLGYTKKELLNLKVYDIDPDIKNRKDNEYIWQNLKSNQSVSLETFHKRKNGTVFPVEIFISSVKLKNKQYVLGIANDISERKLAQQKIIENEQRLKTILNSFQDPVYIVNRNNEIEYMNNALKSKINYQNGQSLKCHQILFDSLTKCNPCTFDKMSSEKNVVSLDLYNKSWNEYHNVTNILLPDGKKLTVHFNITDRKKAEEALKQNERQHRYYSDFLSKVISIDKTEDIYDYVSVSLSKIYPELITVFSSVDEQNMTSKIENIKGVDQNILDKVNEIAGFNLIGTEFPIFEYNIDKFYSGKLINFETGLVEFSNPDFTKNSTKGIEDFLGVNKVYAIGLSYNNKLYAVIRFLALNNFEITNSIFIENLARQIGIVIERKLFEQKLKQSEEKYRLTVNNLPDVILTFYKDKLVSASPVIYKMLGYEKNDFKNATIETFLDLMHPLDKERITKEYYQSLLKKEIFKTYEYRFKHKEGHYLWADQRVSRLFDKDGNLELTVVAARNIDDRIKNEQILKELIATKDKFFGIIAHDLRAPFNSIISFSNLLEEKFQKINDKDIIECVNQLTTNAQNTYKLLENLLNWSQSQTNNLAFSPKVLNLKTITKTAINFLASNALIKNITINNQIDDALQVFADYNMLTSILRNLISNAIKYTKNNGKVIVNAKKVKNKVLVSVKDTGIGITENRVQDIFNIDKTISTYGTNDETGTGLGLIITKEFIDKHNEKIWLETELNKGTVVTFSLELNN